MVALLLGLAHDPIINPNNNTCFIINYWIFIDNNMINNYDYYHPIVNIYYDQL